jgi:hypothetical protein
MITTCEGYKLYSVPFFTLLWLLLLAVVGVGVGVGMVVVWSLLFYDYDYYCYYYSKCTFKITTLTLHTSLYHSLKVN